MVASQQPEYPTIAFPPEIEEGNIEYKLKLVNPSPSRLEHLITQMKWRLKEGEGEALYKIGVEDNGSMSGLLEEELDCSLVTLKNMADRLEAKLTVVNRHEIIAPNQSIRHAAEVMIKKIPNSQEFVDIRVACLGNVDVGKSTLLGVLSHGSLDNGRGRARLNMFRHLHEIQTGHTSSISHEILGFDAEGQELYSGDLTAEDICASAARLITFLDLAGHHKYLKTTILGLTGYSPDLVMLVVAANRGVVGTTKEHLGLAIALKIPFCIVITKTDICGAEATKRTVQQLERILKSPSCKKFPIVVENEEDVDAAASNFDSLSTPIFQVSNVTGKNLDLLRKFYSLLPPQNKEKQRKLTGKPTEFHIDEMFSVRDVGQVIAGTLRFGTIHVDDKLRVGPMYKDNDFKTVTVASIHRNRTPCSVIQAGQTASIAFKEETDCIFRRGQVLLDEKIEVKTGRAFEVELFLLFHTTKISTNFQGTLHIGNIVQRAHITAIKDKDCVKTGQRAKVTFRFANYPEYIKEDDSIFFREGKSKGIGRITHVIE